jgi:hypothetical protein
MRQLLLLLLIIPLQSFSQEIIHVNSTQCLDKKSRPSNTFVVREIGKYTTIGGVKSYVQGDVLQEFCVYRQNNNGEPLTAIIYDEYSNGDLKYEIEYKKGKIVNQWFVYYTRYENQYNHKVKHRDNIFGTVTKSKCNRDIK